MEQGIITRSATNTVNMDSTVMNGIFYRDNGTYIQNANLPTTGFTRLFHVSTPVEEPDYLWTGTFFNYSISISASGIATRDNTFVAPSAIANADNCFNYPPTITNIATQVYSFGTPAVDFNPNNYGFLAYGVVPQSGTTGLAVDRSRKAYYLHPGPNGQALRSGSASSIPSQFQEAQNTYFVPNELVGSTVFFERTFVNPPLIFVTQSSGPIALHYMTKDANGRYNGMTVVAASSPSSPGFISGTSWYSPNTYTYTYFLISDEIPLNVSASEYGMKVFNEFSETVFDSSYLSPTIRFVETTRPSLFLRSWFRTPTCANTNSVVYGRLRSQFQTLRLTEGVCLNNYPSIAGHTAYTSFRGEGGGGIESVIPGPTTFWGIYVRVFDNALGRNAEIQATGTNGILMAPSDSRLGWGNSWEYHNSLLTHVFANYTY